MNELFDVHYVESSESAVISLKQKWDGVKFTFGELSFNESDDKDYCTMSFTYDIMDSSTYEIAELEADENFSRHIGSILESIIRDAVEHEQYKIGNLDAANNSDNNIKKSTEQ